MSPFFGSKKADIDRAKRQASKMLKLQPQDISGLAKHGSSERKFSPGGPGVAIIEYDDLVVVYKYAPGVVDPPCITVRNSDEEEFVMVEQECYPKSHGPQDAGVKK